MSSSTCVAAALTWIARGSSFGGSRLTELTLQIAQAVAVATQVAKPAASARRRPRGARLTARASPQRTMIAPSQIASRTSATAGPTSGLGASTVVSKLIGPSDRTLRPATRVRLPATMASSVLRAASATRTALRASAALALIVMIGMRRSVDSRTTYALVVSSAAAVAATASGTFTGGRSMAGPMIVRSCGATPAARATSRCAEWVVSRSASRPARRPSVSATVDSRSSEGSVRASTSRRADAAEVGLVSVLSGPGSGSAWLLIAIATRTAPMIPSPTRIRWRSRTRRMPMYSMSQMPVCAQRKRLRCRCIR